ncbi:PH domain-containing protein [Corynebacterium argentoratense]|uniref:PH domain-containing protein n=1 Tax=Corynebacterium argentoratense TaxID=42817 RepID=UPI001F3E7488|nr:PH domain-containing protein [Corynebacterium argentoratense]MCF1711717.1 PH domain-containing protein [Corynebacterium argentoratense]
MSTSDQPAVTTQASAHSGQNLFRVDRMNLISAIVMAMMLTLTVGHKPLLLGWFYIIPIGLIVWVLRSSTRVDEEGIHARYVFKKPVDLTWENIDGIGFGRSFAKVTTTDGSQHSLPGVSFNDVSKLAEASRGRIPDVIAQAEQASHDKVTIIHRDGRQVLVDADKAATEQSEN